LQHHRGKAVNHPIRATEEIKVAIRETDKVRATAGTKAKENPRARDEIEETWLG